jgi:hypothetical protein
LVGTSRDADELLATIGYAARDLQEACDADLLTRRKINGQWLYSKTADDVAVALAAVEKEAVRMLRSWLLSGTPFLKGPIARTTRSPVVSVRAVELLLRRLIHAERLATLPLITNEYEPYFGLFAPEDEAEIERQIEAMRALLDSNGVVRSADLPAPRRTRDGNAWRGMILRHGEFSGLGRIEDAVLYAWDYN